MRAIVIKQYGGPEVLAIEERPAPRACGRRSMVNGVYGGS
jgi:NADPH:quinone reductase-like Zn-dependent oxidoreductase